MSMEAGNHVTVEWSAIAVIHYNLKWLLIIWMHTSIIKCFRLYITSEDRYFAQESDYFLK